MLTAQLILIERCTEAALECETFWFGLVFFSLRLQHSSSTRSNFNYILSEASAYKRVLLKYKHTNTPSRHRQVLLFIGQPRRWLGNYVCVNFVLRFHKNSSASDLRLFCFRSALFFFLHFFLYFSVFFGLMRYSCLELRCRWLLWHYLVDRKEKQESSVDYLY